MIRRRVNRCKVTVSADKGRVYVTQDKQKIVIPVEAANEVLQKLETVVGVYQQLNP